ncbi:MAG TPA: hypothetical protein VK867_01340 [Candidatus Limnocylindrales bacterium]|nr:hypothetical protein [Candidatus Limnocylindrales bacterium]
MGIRRTTALIGLLVAACAGPRATPSSPPPATVQPTPSLPAVSTTVSPVSTASAVTPADMPPDASLAAEGGDPVTGQLGTYTWRDGGSDSPWLPGARMTAGAGEPLTMTLEPAATLESWRARLVPATADGPAGAVVLGQGSGPLVFTAPAPGEWTVEVAVVFADALGDASYFWRLEVT